MSNSCSNITMAVNMGCDVDNGRVKSIQVGPDFMGRLKVSKIIYNYKGKSDRQIKDAIQLEIDIVIAEYPDYRFKDSKSHFNKTGGIEMVLNFEKL